VFCLRAEKVYYIAVDSSLATLVHFHGKKKLSLCSTKHHAMKTKGGVEV
jgi:hypothetical protein